MKLSISREALLEPLQMVTGVVEKRQTLPVLSNLLFRVQDNSMMITASDQEVELNVERTLTDDNTSFVTTIPARKFLEICKSLRPEAQIDITFEYSKILLSSGRFRSHLVTLPANDFPKVEMDEHSSVVLINRLALLKMLEETSFAMAQQDVRYFFNGMLFELMESALHCVATNGQRLALSKTIAKEMSNEVGEKEQYIIPRKGIIELLKLIKHSDDEVVTLSLATNHLKAVCGKASLLTKLIDGAYPEYQKTIPRGSDYLAVIDRLEFKEALARISILTHEMYRNVKLGFSSGEVKLEANNPQQEDAEEILKIAYEGPQIDIAFNVSYLNDVLSTVKSDTIEMYIKGGDSAVLLRNPEDENGRFVVSPMMV